MAVPHDPCACAVPDAPLRDKRACRALRSSRNRAVMAQGLGRNAALALLFAVSLMNYCDRWSVAAVLNDLQAPPAADGSLNGGFGLSDTSAGLVSSAFVVTYMTLSPAFGFLGDRFSRIPLMFLGTVLYAVSVFCSSFARYYYQFLVFRSLVGVGEASFAVMAPSVIADMYPSGAERTIALGYFCTSIPLGSALGYVYAGEVSRLLGWRYAFRLSPCLSFVLSSILVLTVAEPERGVVDGLADTPRSPREDVKVSFSRDVMTVLGTRSFFLSNMGAIGATFTSGALAVWAPSFLQRVNCETSDMNCASDVLRMFGLVAIVSGVIGTIAGSQVARWYAKRNPAADAMVCALGSFLATPCVFASIYLAPLYPGRVTWIAIFVAEVLVSTLWAPYTAILVGVVTPQQRSTANSISLLTTHLFGDSLSPVVIGMVADLLHSSSHFTMSKAVSLQNALYISVISSIVGAFFFLSAGRFLPSDRARALAGRREAGGDIELRHPRPVPRAKSGGGHAFTLLDGSNDDDSLNGEPEVVERGRPVGEIASSDSLTSPRRV